MMSLHGNGWSSARNSRILLVMDGRQSRGIEIVLGERDLEPIRVCTCEAARDVLAANSKIELVITEDILPDGDWRHVVRVVRDTGMQAEILVRHTSQEEAEQIEEATVASPGREPGCLEEEKRTPFFPRRPAFAA